MIYDYNVWILIKYTLDLDLLLMIYFLFLCKFAKHTGQQRYSSFETQYFAYHAIGQIEAVLG